MPQVVTNSPLLKGPNETPTEFREYRRGSFFCVFDLVDHREERTDFSKGKASIAHLPKLGFGFSLKSVLHPRRANVIKSTRGKVIEFVFKNPTISLNDLNKIIACERLIKFEAAQ